MALVSNALLRMIQVAITPVILIIGLDSLMLTMTNRLGRIVDRTWILTGLARAATGEDQSPAKSQLRMLFRRAKLVRMAVSLVALSMFVSGLLVVVIFLSALLGVEAGPVLLVLFVAAISLFLAALTYFRGDITLTPNAFGQEVRRAVPEA